MTDALCARILISQTVTLSSGKSIECPTVGDYRGVCPLSHQRKKNAETQGQDHAEFGTRPIAAAREKKQQEPTPTCAGRCTSSRSRALCYRHAIAAHASDARFTSEGRCRRSRLLGKPRFEDRKQQDRALAAGATQALFGAEYRPRRAVHTAGGRRPGCNARRPAIEN